MKLNRIAALCKQKKQAAILECEQGRHGQWIGNGSALYPVEGLPHIDKTALLTIFDVPEKDREKWFFTETTMPLQYDVSDYQDGEIEVSTFGMGVAYAGMILKPIFTKRGVIFIDARYLSPLADFLDVLGFAVRYTPGGDPYIIARAGFLIQAIIMPWGGIAPDFAANVRQLANACDRAVEDKQAQERKDNPPQYSFGVDTETGEVKEENTAPDPEPKAKADEKPLQSIKGGKGK